MLSDHIPADAIRHPSLHGGKMCLIRVPTDAQAEMRHIFSEEVGHRGEHLSWYSTDFGSCASNAYQAMGSPSLSFDTAWEVFAAMAQVMNL